MALGTALFLAGGVHYQLDRARLPAWENLPSREAQLVLRVERTFTPTDPRRFTGIGTVTASDRHLHDLRGQRLYFSLRLPPDAPRPVRSSELRVLGVLELLPDHPPADSFDAYLADAGLNFRLTRGQVQATVRPAAVYYQFCAGIAARCRHILGLGIAGRHPTLTGLLRAMMLGETHELSEGQRQLFMQSGTMHLFAISGLNIGVIAGALQALLLLLRLPNVIRLVISLMLLWLFVDITGASASAVRAFIMAAFLQAAFVLRQPASPLAALTGSAWCVLLLAPQQLFSASFQMSYGIVGALLLLGLPLGDAWQARWTPFALLPKAVWRWWHRWIDWGWHWLSTAVAIGIASTLVSLLTGVQFFQLLTPGALLANLVLIPGAMLATLGGFASLAVGLAGLDRLAVLFNHAAALTLLVIEWFVQVSVQVPWSHQPANFVHPRMGSAALAALLGAMLYGYARRWVPESGSWWPPFVITALTLIFGVKFG
jgi:competence protein ComEC